MRNRIGSAKQAKSEIGFEAKVSLEEGLRELIGWRRGHIDQVEQRRRKAAA